MQIHFFLVGSKCQLTTGLEVNVQVHENKLICESITSPSQLATVIDVAEEVSPSCGIAGVWDPNSNDIINEPFEKGQTCQVFLQQSLDLQDSNMQESTVNCHAGTHCTPLNLSPESVTELECIVFHCFTESSNKEVDGYFCRQAFLAVGETLWCHFHAVFGVNI